MNTQNNDKTRNVIIIGSGPAGYTAALYTARANLSPLLIAGNLDPKTMRIKGGQLMYTSDIENFPGAVETPIENLESLKGVSGPELMKRMEMQGAPFRHRNAGRVRHRREVVRHARRRVLAANRKR